MPQLLHLQNGESIVRRIRAPEGRLAELLKSHRPDAEVVEELFLATLTRRPTAEEYARIDASLKQCGQREEFYRDLFWALLNAKEFAFAH
jgi:hypothetical protein